MIGTLGAALAAGLVASPHCVGMCGGLASACMRPRGGLFLWHAGRLTTYAVLGTLAGAFGAVLPGPAWVPGAVAAALLLWFALAIAGVAPEPRPPVAWMGRAGARLAGRAGPASRYLFGSLTGLLPCGMVYAALSVPLALRDPLFGALAMVAFGAGTVPALVLFPTALRALAARGVWQRRAVGVLVLAAGLYAIGMRTVVGGHPRHDAAASDAPAAHGGH